ncbi:MAG: protein kinase [Myxococcales bacterium]|nr:protein kinase [Myxococcales bacterium]
MKQGHHFLGTFEVKRLLQRSARSEVYHAWDTTLRRDVCLKILHRRSSTHAEPDSLYDEARYVSDLRSPYTVRVYTSGALPRRNGIYFVMEWAEGGSVRDWLAHQGRLTVSQWLLLAAQVGHSLAEAHAKGLVHRDIKPANLLLFLVAEQERIVKVADFGISTTVVKPGSATRAAVMGTPEYLAPEVWESGVIDPRADIYALGVTGYYCLTGQLPFRGDSFTTLRDAHRFEPVPPFAPQLQIPPAVSKTILRCLAKSPDDRPDNIAVLLSEMGTPALLGGTPYRIKLNEEIGQITVISTPTVTEHTLDDLIDTSATPNDTAPPLRELRVVSGTWVQGDATELAAWEERVTNAGGLVVFRGADERLAVFGHTGQGAEAPLRAARLAALGARFGKAAAHTIKVSAHELVAHDRIRSLLEPTLRKLVTRAQPGEPVVSRKTFERIDRSVGPVTELLSQTTTTRTPPTESIDEGWVAVPEQKPWSIPTVETGSVDLVGRAAELQEILHRIGQGTRRKQPGVVWVIGEAGIGKTRLCHDVRAATAVQLRGIQWITTAAFPEDSALPFAVLRRFLWTLLDLPEETFGKPLQERLEARLSAANVVGYRAVSRDLCQLLDPEPRADTTATPPRRPDPAQLAASIADLVKASVLSAGLVTLLEDIHWADRDSMTLLATVIESLEGTAAFWIWSGRPQSLEHHREINPGQGRHHLLQLGALTGFLTEQLCRNLVMSVVGDIEPLVTYLSKKTDGVPLYAEELLRLCAQRGVVFKTEDGPWMVDVTKLDEDLVPPSLESVLLQRIEHLDAPDRQVAQACAILGRRISGASLDLLLKWDPTHNVPAALERLVKAFVLVPEPTGAPDLSTYRFSHALLADAAYQTVLESDRLVWHQRAAEWFESRAQTRLSLEWMAIAAEHWDRCGNLERAFEAHDKAADLAQTAFAIPAARVHLQRCHAIGERWPLSPLARTTLLVKTGRLFAHEQKYKEALEYYQQAEEWLTAGTQTPESAAYRHHWATIQYVRALVVTSQGHHNDAQAWCEQALVMLKRHELQPNDRILAARIGNWLGWTLRRRGEFAAAETIVQTALQDLGFAGPDRERSTLLSALASLYADLNRPTELVRQCHEQAITLKRTLYERDGDAKPLGAAIVNYASYLISANYLPEARLWLDQATKIANDIEDQEMRAVILVNLAELSLSEHQPDDALRHLDRAQKLAQQRGFLWMMNEIDRLTHISHKLEVTNADPQARENVGPKTRADQDPTS